MKGNKVIYRQYFFASICNIIIIFLENPFSQTICSIRRNLTWWPIVLVSGPGPGRYFLPSTCGYMDHDSTKQEQPAYVFGHRLSDACKYTLFNKRFYRKMILNKHVGCLFFLSRWSCTWDVPICFFVITDFLSAYELI